MATIEFQNVGIVGMSAAVPSNVINNYLYTEHFPEEDVKIIVDKIGVKERRFVDANTCASDLCFAAATRLIDELKINRQEIDLLIFISQTPDYRMPATAIILQDRLKLNKSTAAFDMNLGCSAFIYGLSVVYSMMQTGSFRKALILNGETRSKVYHPKDRKTAFLFGDAGVAVLIENGDSFGKSYFTLNSDGSKESLIKIKSGGYRYPSSEDSIKEKIVDEHGNKRTDEHGFMNGADVFNFVLSEVPNDIQNILRIGRLTYDQINFIVFHQANSYMLQYLAKKLKIPDKKVLKSIENFGNTSSVSIPLTMVYNRDVLKVGRNKLLLSGFGVGMSWGSAILEIENCWFSEIIEI